MDQPVIRYANWGRVVTLYNNNTEIHGDIILFEGGVIGWDWRITGTRHIPGISVNDILHVKKILENPEIFDNSIILLSLGYKKKLRISSELYNYLNANNIKYIIGSTNKIIKIYNNLVKSRRVIAFIHTTC